jgi:pimeloyl-ACP methyl ester carboxylesterase
MQESEPTATRPLPKARKWRKSAARVLSAVVVIYLLGGVALYFGQSWLLFPGAFIHDRAKAKVGPAPGREIITLHNVGGHRITAVFGAAEDAAGAPLPDAAHRPTLLFLYGNGDCVWTSMGLFRTFRQLGANVLIPEYVGYPMSSGRPSEQSFYDTAMSAYSYLLTRPDVDPKQIIVVGRSIGSGPAVDLAARKPVAALATFSAFTSMDEMAQKVIPIYPTGLLCSAHFDNWRKMPNVTCPVFLAHGTQDDFVPFTMMARLAAQAHVPVAVVPVEGADHNEIFVVGGSALMQKFGEFIDSIHRAKSGNAQ